MSVAILFSRALVGLETPEVRVEVHLANGLPSFQIVGLPEASVRESRERVRSALQHCGFGFPAQRITVNLAPADLPKDSSRFDLPIAVGVLAANGQLPLHGLAGLEFVGELSLSGELRPVRGALALVHAVASGHRRRLVLPSACRAEAGLIDGAQSLLADSLTQVCAHIHGAEPLELVRGETPVIASTPRVAGLDGLRGQHMARLALRVAAAGGHHLLLMGPPGAGKTLLASALPALLPAPEPTLALQSALVQSIVQPVDPARWGQRPFRAPHHSASGAALIGGGGTPQPGEITLAHGGVLFLDELPEFGASVLDTLRQPLESGEITISRASRKLRFPARFQLVAAMNPCPCGMHGSTAAPCTCRPDQVRRYLSSISGPLLDRIDLRVRVDAVPPDELLRPADPGEPQDLTAPIEAAARRQRERQGMPNAALDLPRVNHELARSPDARLYLQDSAAKFAWSARACHRVVRVARTLADLSGHDRIERSDMGQAILFRRPLVGA